MTITCILVIVIKRWSYWPIWGYEIKTIIMDYCSFKGFTVTELAKQVLFGFKKNRLKKKYQS